MNVSNEVQNAVTDLDPATLRDKMNPLNFNERKAKRIMAYKYKRDGVGRCPHESTSLSPTRRPVPPGSQHWTAQQALRNVVCEPKMATHYLSIDCRQGELYFCQIPLHTKENQRIQVTIEPQGILKLCANPRKYIDEQRVRNLSYWQPGEVTDDDTVLLL